MKCLCCNKEIDSKSKPEEFTSQWHNACIMNFFGIKTIPQIDISKEAIEQLANESTKKGYTIPGVQKKLSIHLSLEDKHNPRLTLVNYPTGYILKPQTEEYEALPEAEFLIMSMAKVTKIKTVPFALLKIKNEYSYITKRIDRVINDNQIQKLAMEDFCQLENRLTADKYRGSYERCANVIETYSSSKLFDMSELFLRILFSFIVGNSDMHLKNFSLIETSQGSEIYHLSPAYDLLPVNIILPDDKEELALSLNGKKQNLTKKDFLNFASYCGLEKVATRKMIDKIISLKDTYIKMCEESYLPNKIKSDLINLIENRTKRLID